MTGERKRLEIDALLYHVTALYQEDELRAREERVVKIAHWVRKSREMSPPEKERMRMLLAGREWEMLKEYLETL